MTQRPILVTGSHRSGTTWTARMLALSPGTALVGREPFNTGPRQWALSGLAERDYAYAPGLDEDGVERAFHRVLAGRAPRLVGRQGSRQQMWLAPWCHPRVIVKDPLAAMSAGSPQMTPTAGTWQAMGMQRKRTLRHGPPSLCAGDTRDPREHTP